MTQKRDYICLGPKTSENSRSIRSISTQRVASRHVVPLDRLFTLLKQLCSHLRNFLDFSLFSSWNHWKRSMIFGFNWWIVLPFWECLLKMIWNNSNSKPNAGNQKLSPDPLYGKQCNWLDHIISPTTLTFYPHLISHYHTIFVQFVPSLMHFYKGLPI